MRRVQTSDVIDFEVIGVARIVAGPEEKVDVGGNVTRDDGGVSADQEDTLVLKFNKNAFPLADSFTQLLTFHGAVLWNYSNNNDASTDPLFGSLIHHR